MIFIIDNGSPNMKHINHIVQDHGAQTKVIPQNALYNSFAHHKPSGIILSGGDPNLDQKIFLSEIRANLAALLNYDVPIYGICEGHEIIGEVFGGDIRKMLTRVHTEKNRIRIVKHHALFTGIPREFEGFEAHTRYVRDLPHSFELLATSSKTTIEAFAHKEKKIFGTQFHPEKSGDVGKQILKNFVKMCK